MAIGQTRKFLLESLRKTLRMVWRHDLAGNRASVREHYRIGSYALTRNQRHYCSTIARLCRHFGH